jgi:hypothetical protein
VDAKQHSCCRVSVRSFSASPAALREVIEIVALPSQFLAQCVLQIERHRAVTILSFLLHFMCRVIPVRVQCDGIWPTGPWHAVGFNCPAMGYCNRYPIHCLP